MAKKGHIVRLSSAVQKIYLISEDIDVYLVFDKYQDFSIKRATRANHGKNVKNPTYVINCQMQ